MKEETYIEVFKMLAPGYIFITIVCLIWLTVEVVKFQINKSIILRFNRRATFWSESSPVLYGVSIGVLIVWALLLIQTFGPHL